MTSVRSRYDLLFLLALLSELTDLHPAIEDVYIRAFNGLVTRPVAGYRYSANWETCTGRTFTRKTIN